jgi:acyl carrier protein
MNNQEIATKLTHVFKKVFADDALELTNDMTANSLEQWDSLTHMILITAVEESFAIKFKLKDLNRMRNVGDMIEMIASKL